MELKNIYAIIEPEINEVETRLRDVLYHSPLSIANLAEDILKTGGKRLRPALVLLSGKTCNYQGKSLIDIATAVELIHTATLIHDDVIDNATLRRGMASVNSRWGNHISILVGDYLCSKAISLLLIEGDIGLQRIVSSAVNKTCEGEIIQSMNNGHGDISEAEYLEIIEQKTAALISASCHCGAYLCEQDEKQCNKWQSYGQNLGMGFQIIDDILDMTGDEKRLGKLVCNDLREGRITLPVIFFLNNAQAGEISYFECIMRSEDFDDSDIKWIVNRLHLHHAFEYARGVADKYISMAKEAINDIPDSEAKRTLLLLGDYVMERDM
ncbi:polyprenyl synthetase [Candidatus Desantisbacteria bacterium CG_4_9_14_3_um_filter_40_11]|uniref:Polyprenyl synthetase n=4 Tax=unclassified Candidatus Desantisiibacteriota TaxID=3106372 RepID=A0A2M7P4V0_9BACT|nr:MAG: polyprenyl synthetase [Candidatus Desantisbacteria bacterium CG23_combo_of_CG06-09_8_20_14_all_40_23]PIY20328.1 MAG: polyprenyl synthetase [Candidatus Desantisbacteria bacterium CG_4_10_14_3_um_filter_40_18]PJB29703.1 MAG: polyprenyl synthetase [Candidatus Desantisbacteria bacterium CG_4_9_14_3_um_filter_40_11]